MVMWVNASVLDVGIEMDSFYYYRLFNIVCKHCMQYRMYTFFALI